MSSPRNPDRDLGLERLGDREDLRPAHLGQAAQVSSSLGPASSAREFLAAYQALIDAVFTSHGAAEWLFELRLKVAALLAGKDPPAPRGEPVPRDAIRAAHPGPGRA